MHNCLRMTLLGAMMGVLTLSGCTTTPPPKPVVRHEPVANRPIRPPEPPPLPPPPPEKDQLAAEEGVKLYNAGNYNAAIKLLTTSDEIWKSGATPAKLTALKYSAFSYCVTNRMTLCRRQFEKAFRLDPAFALEPGESGHPLWTPAFTQAQRNTTPKKR